MTPPVRNWTVTYLGRVESIPAHTYVEAAAIAHARAERRISTARAGIARVARATF